MGRGYLELQDRPMFFALLVWIQISMSSVAPGLESGKQVQLPDSLTPCSFCALQPSVRQWARVDQEVRLEPLQAVLQVLQQGPWIYQGKWERCTMSLQSVLFNRSQYFLMSRLEIPVHLAIAKYE
jgi:hypothetical protein